MLRPVAFGTLRPLNLHVFDVLHNHASLNRLSLRDVLWHTPSINEGPNEGHLSPPRPPHMSLKINILVNRHEITINILVNKPEKQSLRKKMLHSSGGPVWPWHHLKQRFTSNHILHQTTVYTLTTIYIKSRLTQTTVHTKLRLTPTTVYSTPRFVPTTAYTKPQLNKPTTPYLKARFIPTRA